MRVGSHAHASRYAMSSIVITVHQKGSRLDTIQSLIQKHVKAKFPDAAISVERKEPAESRSARFDGAQSLAADAKSQAEELRDELQNWHDNLPENLKQGEKAGEIESAIDSLQEFVDALETAESVEVEFPGMY